MDRDLISRSFLLITLDSCRYDTFTEAQTPRLGSLGELYKAMAPGTFTHASHCAIFVGFTPGVAERQERFVNPKFGKFFKLVGPGFQGKGGERVKLTGRNIISGFRREGYEAIGSGAVKWFDPETEMGRHLSQDFEEFYYPGNCWSLPEQVSWLVHRVTSATRPVFAFLNVGETHVPYYYQGAPWSPKISPCIPFSEANDAGECRRRQRLCLEYVDVILAPLLDLFREGTSIVCGDHGDCWGEDGLWEHGIHHPKVIEVPLLFRVAVPDILGP